MKKLSFEKNIEELNPENFIVGAFFESQLMGICGFYRMADSRCKHRGELIQMFVQPDFQGKGIGFDLLKTTIKEAFKLSGLTQIELGVMTNVRSAIKIYNKAGFKEFGLQKNFLNVDGVSIDLSMMVLHKTP